METCACCGQVISTSTRASVQVDDDLLRLCNDAFALAEQRGEVHVDVAHLLMCIARSSVERSSLERIGVSRLALYDACLTQLAALPRQSLERGLTTSADLKALLALAERHAQSDRREFASPADLVTTFFHHGTQLKSCAATLAALSGRALPSPTEPISLASREHRHEPAEYSATETRGWPRREHQLALRRGPMGRAASTQDEPGDAQEGTAVDSRHMHHAEARWQQESAHRSPSPGPGPGRLEQTARPAHGRDPDQRDLLERLHRQEGQLAELRALVGQLLDHQGGQGSSAADIRHGAVGGDDSRQVKRSALRRARVRDRNGNVRRPLYIFGTSSATRERRGNPRSSDGLSRESRHHDRSERRQQRSLRMPRDLGPFADPLTTPADNDTEDDDTSANGRMKRFYLSPDDDIVKAPSIGPRTAARLTPAGLVLVRDLLNCDAEDVASRVGARYINAARVNEWKAQARLVCTIPWLRGMHAQLLVGAGFDTLPKLVRADASAVCAAVLRFSATREGQSILRSGPPPEIDRIACWIENTALAEPARAA